MEENTLNGNGSKSRTRSGAADFMAFLFPKGGWGVPGAAQLTSLWVHSLATETLMCAYRQG